MARTPPKLRQHATGQWMAHWAGKNWYFGVDRGAAERFFFDPGSDHPGSLKRWQEWASRRFAPSRSRAPERVTVAELAARFLAEYALAGRRGPESYYRRSLRRFLNVFGRFFTDELDEVGLEEFLGDLRALRPPLAPKTIAHDLNAAKALLRWGSRATVRLAPRLDLDALKPPRVRRGAPEDLPLAQVKALIRRAAEHTPQLGVWLSLNYLASLRPSEVARLAHGQGKLRTIPPEGEQPAIADAYLELSEHKTVHRVDHPRLIPLSPEALTYFRSLVPLPRASRRSEGFDVAREASRYVKFCARAGVPGLPHRLRDSAATHLLATGSGLEASVDLLLGHEPSGELSRYGRPSLRVLRALAGRLTLR